MHVDMAFPVYSVSMLYCCMTQVAVSTGSAETLIGHTFYLQGERATGYGVALLVTLFGDYSEDQLLRSLGPKLKRDRSEIENPCKKFKRI